MTTPELILLASLAVAVLALAWVLFAWMRFRREAARSPESAYTLGLSALVGGERRNALRFLKEAVQADSENLDAYIRLGDLLRELGDPGKALAIHRDLTVRPHVEDETRMRILESMTRDYLGLGRYEEAGQSAERLRQVSRQNRFALTALVEVAEALKDWPRAVQFSDELAKLSGDKENRQRALYRGYVGGEELAAGKVAEAKRRFEEALKLDASCRPALLFLGDLAYREGNGEAAITRWREFADQAPEKASLVFDRLERATFELGQFGDMVRFYRELLHRMPREAAVPALLALAEIHRRKGETDEAETFVQEALEIAPEHPRAHRHMVKIALDRRDASAALSRLEKLLDSLPVSEDAAGCRGCGVAVGGPKWRCDSCGILNPLDI